MGANQDLALQRARSRPDPRWLLLLALAAVELAGHFAILSRVVPLADWRAAAAFVRGEMTSADAVEVAPAWADPMLRWVLGDRIPFAVAGRSDLSGLRRLWTLSIRGHRPADAPSRPPSMSRRFGRVLVERWELPRPAVVYDFVANVRDAEVALTGKNGSAGAGPQSCQRRVSTPEGGGLGAGPMKPAERFECDPRRPWLWVGATVMEDLELNPRWCVWQHPAGSDPVTVTYRNVPLGRSLVLYGGLYYEHERMRLGGPVHVTVRVNGEEVSSMVHRDGDGWKRLRADTRAGGAAGERGDVTFEVSAREPHLRSLCWAATTRSEPP